MAPKRSRTWWCVCFSPVVLLAQLLYAGLLLPNPQPSQPEPVNPAQGYSTGLACARAPPDWPPESRPRGCADVHEPPHDLQASVIIISHSAPFPPTADPD